MDRRTEIWPRRTLWLLAVLFLLVLLLGIVIGVLIADVFLVDSGPAPGSTTSLSATIPVLAETTAPAATATPFPTATAILMPTSSPTQEPAPTLSPTSTTVPLVSPTTAPLVSPTTGPTSTAVPSPAPTVTPPVTPTSSSTPAPVVTPASTATATAVATPTATATVAIVDWRAAYYDNPTLSGEPVLVRNDEAVDFDWDYGSPAPALPSDAFSARWTRALNFEGGTYRFYASMDDGLQLWIDDELLIDEWHDGGLRQVTAERELEAGSHTLEVVYYDAQGAARAHVWWERPDAYADWQGVYWANPEMEGNPVLIRNDVAIDFDWGDGPPADALPVDEFSARWMRRIVFEAGAYRFHVLADDGVQLWVDEEMIVEAWDDRDLDEFSADLDLSRGEHAVRLEYVEHAFEARVSMWWERVGELAYPDWKGEYWANQDLLGEPMVVRNDPEINFRWEAGSPALGLPADRFSARWSRELTLTPGVYRFYARADDGIRLFVDERLVLDEWHSSEDRVYEVDERMAGEHALRVEFYERTGDARVYVWWQRIRNYPY